MRMSELRPTYVYAEKERQKQKRIDKTTYIYSTQTAPTRKDQRMLHIIGAERCLRIVLPPSRCVPLLPDVQSCRYSTTSQRILYYISYTPPHIREHNETLKKERKKLELQAASPENRCHLFKIRSSAAFFLCISYYSRFVVYSRWKGKSSSSSSYILSARSMYPPCVVRNQSIQEKSHRCKCLMRSAHIIHERGEPL
jgi:hypothetical protein